MDQFALKTRAGDVCEGLRALYERRAQDRIFATISVPHPSPTLEHFRSNHVAGECPYPDPAERIAFWASLLAERPQVEDDSLPGCYLTEMDQGIYGGVLGGEVRWMCNPDTGWISSMVPRLLDNWEDIPSLHFNPEHPFFVTYMNQLRIFAAGARGNFGMNSLCVGDGLNFMMELVGATESYRACIEAPEYAQAGIDLAYTVATAIHDAFFEEVPLFNGGTCSLNQCWIPGRAVMDSVDAFHMASPAFFEQWGRATLERTLAHYDGGEIHLHGNGRHLLKGVATVRGLKAITIGDDKGFAPGFEVLADLQKQSGDMPLASFAGYEAFKSSLAAHTLPGGVLYHVWGAPSVLEANLTMEQVRAYRL